MLKEDLEKYLIVAPIETDISEEEVKKEIMDTEKYNIRGIQVDEFYVDLAQELLADRDVRLGMIVSYPLGAMTTSMKVKLTEYAVSKELDEIDLGLDYNAIKSGDFERAKEDLAKVIVAANNKLDVIAIPLVAQMTLDELDNICEMLVNAGIKRIKTNSGMGLGSTRLEHVKFLKRKYGSNLAIEVSGGVRTTEQAKAFVEAGVSAIHSSTWKNIVS